METEKEHGGNGSSDQSQSDALPFIERASCPECNANWVGEDIFAHFMARRQNGDKWYANKTVEEIQKVAGDYGWTPEKPKTFRHIIGISNRDHIIGWACPECKRTWTCDGRLLERRLGDD